MDLNWRIEQGLRREIDDLQARARKRNTPADLFFEGLTLELPKAAAEGRLEDWQRCSESIAALLTSYAARNVPDAAALTAPQ